MESTNEELALRVQRGETELTPQLWEQVVKFIAMRARAYIAHKKQNGFYCDGEEVDLVNQAYFGFLTAIRLFDPGAGSFLRILDLAIKSSFSEASGYRKASQRADCIHIAASGDAPIGEDEFNLFDTIPDDGESVEEVATKGLYLHQLRDTLDCALQELPQQQEAILRARYYENRKPGEVAEKLGCTRSNIGQQEQAALSALYHARFENGLNEYLEQNTNYVMRIGVKRFKNTGVSAVEAIVLQREHLVEKWMRTHYPRAREGRTEHENDE